MGLLDFGNAIAGIESGGRYDALGPMTKGDRAYGKYQVMGSNVGPWTEKFYGKRLSPDEYLANPEAQEAVFQGQFGTYVQKYGPEGAAKAWFAGERGMKNPNAKDVLGTSVDAYGKKFMAGLGPQEPAPQGILAVAQGVQPQPGLAPQSMPQQAQMPARQMQPIGGPIANFAQEPPNEPPPMMQLAAYRPQIKRLAQAPSGVFSFGR
mgnify:CR=1 FL=1